MRCITRHAPRHSVRPRLLSIVHEGEARCETGAQEEGETRSTLRLHRPAPCLPVPPGPELQTRLRLRGHNKDEGGGTSSGRHTTLETRGATDERPDKTATRSDASPLTVPWLSHMNEAHSSAGRSSCLRLGRDFTQGGVGVGESGRGPERRSLDGSRIIETTASALRTI